MTFAGISSEKQRADLIDYLNTLSHSPLPLPKPQAGAASPPAGTSPPAASPGGAAPQQH
jgi:cytochrome c